jgi:hypothetical protein
MLAAGSPVPVGLPSWPKSLIAVSVICSVTAYETRAMSLVYGSLAPDARGKRRPMNAPPPVRRELAFMYSIGATYEAP